MAGVFNSYRRAGMAGVFISYARQDQEFARRLYAALRAAGVAAWVDLEGIALSMSWQDEVRAAIEAADTFIFVLSPDSIVSDWCQNELDAALSLGKRIIPIIARDVSASEVPLPLSIYQRLDFTRADGFDAAARELAQSLGPAMARVGTVAQAMGLAQAEPRRASLSPFVLTQVVILALLMVVGVIVLVFTPLLGPGGSLFSLSPQYLTQLFALHSYTWLSVTAGSVLLNLALITEMVILRRGVRVARAEALETQSPSGEIFISYSRSDGEFVDKLEEDLGKEGFKTWVDRRQLKGGQIWDATIVDALNRCQIALVVLSPDALNSGWVKKEYRYAAKCGKTLVPILFHPCPSIPKTLSRFEQLDFRAGLNFEAKYRYAFVELVSALETVPVARVETAA